MTTFVWLREGTKLNGKWDIKTDAKSGLRYVTIVGEHMLDPTNDIWKIPKEIVAFVTYRTIVSGTPCAEGLYQQNGVDIFVRSSYGGTSYSSIGVPHGKPVPQQEISAKGPNVLAIWTAYGEVLSQKLAPTLPLNQAVQEEAVA